MKLLSIIVPVYYEEECIDQFIKEMTPVLEAVDYQYELIFIDDGSKDNTVQIIKSYASQNPSIKLIELSYNQGKQAAVSAGIDHSKGDLLIAMDPDLQDPPNEIPNLIEEMNKGFDVGFGIRKEKVDGLFNKIWSKIFWSILSSLSGINIPKGISSMRIFNRKFADKFLEYPEQNRFVEGIFVHIGMRQSTLKIAQRARFAGKTKFNFRRKLSLAFNIIFDFSELPLKIAAKLGFILFLFGLVFLFGLFILKLFFIDFELGWPSLIGTIILGTGIQLFFIGILAIYLGRIYRETKRRPLFSIKNLTNF